MFITQHGIIDSAQGVQVARQRMNINSISTSDKDLINLGNSVSDNIRTISTRITLTQDINTSVNNGIYTFVSRYNLSNRTGSYALRFNNGKIEVIFWNGSAFISIKSNLNNWSLGQVIDVTTQFNSSAGRLLFIDGVKQTQTHAYFGDSLTSVYDTVIGRLGDVDVQHCFLKIENVQFWTKELTITEINDFIGVVPDSSEVGLKECYPFADETGINTTGIKGGNGVITTSNAGGITHINNTIRELI